MMMKLDGTKFRRSCCLHLLLISSLAYSCSAAQSLDPVITKCPSDDTNSPSVAYQQYRKNLLIKMESESSISGFKNDTEGSGSDQVYVSYFCQGRLPAANCSQCVNAAVNELLTKCPNNSAAQTWYNECNLKYSDENFFGELMVDDWVTWCGYGDYIKNSSAKAFNKVLYDTLNKVANQAAIDEARFATKEADLTFLHDSATTLYTSAQCVPDLSPAICLQCLIQSINHLPKFCNNTKFGRTICSSCIVWHTVDNPFYAADKVATSPSSAGALPPILPPANGNGPSILQHRKKGKEQYKLIPIVILIPIVVVLLALGMWCYLRYREPLNEFEGTDMEEITSAESFQMDFSKVRAATLNFAPDKKLGEGGFGYVFKGTLENKQEIAVKRLITSNSGQGAAEFKNEVVLVAKLQHRNLVKLLGFCLSGEEKILVYEYLPNSSLDKVLFDPIKRASLNWETRFNIVCGIAKGLLYLHEDSRLRIIHRDLKSSNILLDEAMNAKISDFGIAKTLALDQTRESTGTLVGTYAYMAPEYLLTGQYSLKSDIYSFGIIVLETVTGQRNQPHFNPLVDEALLHRAWRLWTENLELEMVDSALNESYSKEEAIKCIHIGLLCIQEDAARRPRMTSIVAALSGQSIDLPPPTPPNFFNFNSSASPLMASTSATTVTKTTDTTQASLPPSSLDD